MGWGFAGAIHIDTLGRSDTADLSGVSLPERTLGLLSKRKYRYSRFSGCLLSVYKGYVPDQRNRLGWGMVVFGCIFLALISSIELILIVPLALLVGGFWLADLFLGNWWRDGGDVGGSDGFFGDDGGCGGGDGGCD